MAEKMKKMQNLNSARKSVARSKRLSIWRGVNTVAGYNAVHNIRRNKKDGGSSVFVRHDIPFVQLKTLDDFDIVALSPGSYVKSTPSNCRILPNAFAAGAQFGLAGSDNMDRIVLRDCDVPIVMSKREWIESLFNVKIGSLSHRNHCTASDSNPCLFVQGSEASRMHCKSYIVSLCDPKHTETESYPVSHIRRLLNHTETLRTIERESHAHLWFESEPKTDSVIPSMTRQVVFKGSDCLAVALAISALDDVMEEYSKENDEAEIAARPSGNVDGDSANVSTITSRRHQASAALDVHLKKMVSVVEGDDPQTSFRADLDTVVKRSVLSVMRDATQDFSRDEPDGSDLDVSCCNASLLGTARRVRSGQSTLTKKKQLRRKGKKCSSISKHVLRENCKGGKVVCSKDDCVKDLLFEMSNAECIDDAEDKFSGTSVGGEISGNHADSVTSEGAKKLKKLAKNVGKSGTAAERCVVLCDYTVTVSNTDKTADSSVILLDDTLKANESDVEIKLENPVADDGNAVKSTRSNQTAVAEVAFVIQESVEKKKTIKDSVISVSDAMNNNFLHVCDTTPKPLAMKGKLDVSVVDLTCDSPVVQPKPSSVPPVLTSKCDELSEPKEPQCTQIKDDVDGAEIRTVKVEPWSISSLVKPSTKPLRYIVIDGSNVAMAHGCNKQFSCRGIELCVDYFRSRGHTEIIVFVPQTKQGSGSGDIRDQHILNRLNEAGTLVWTPARKYPGKTIVCYDDRYVLKLAEETNGVVVSNDNYRDLFEENPRWRDIIKFRLLMFTFVGDRFMPPDDPLGKDGPTLDHFLLNVPLKTDQAHLVSRNNFQPCSSTSRPPNKWSENVPSYNNQLVSSGSSFQSSQWVQEYNRQQAVLVEQRHRAQMAQRQRVLQYQQFHAHLSGRQDRRYVPYNSRRSRY